MAKTQFSTKRIAIDKANGVLIIAVSIATFVVMFSLVASKELLSQRSYQAKVISKKELARNTLESNIQSLSSLKTTYEEFTNTSPNVLKGNPSGDGDRDGDNAKIVLDALPSRYDFPALATSIEKILKENKFKLTNITGVDEEASQSTNQASDNPATVEIPFSLEAQTSASAGKSLVALFERSIRPVQVKRLVVSGSDGRMIVKIDARTYFMPGKTLDIKSEVVK